MKTMPYTRATRAKTAAVNNIQAEKESPILSAKTRSTRAGVKSTRQHLQNITNPKATKPVPVTKKRPRSEASKKHDSSDSMQTNSKNEDTEPALEAAKLVSALVLTPPNQLHAQKRKSPELEVDASNKYAVPSSNKKFKQTEKNVNSSQAASFESAEKLNTPEKVPANNHYYIDDKPSTSKAAMAALAATTAAASLADSPTVVAGSAKNDSVASTASPFRSDSSAAPVPTITPPPKGGQKRSLRKHKRSEAGSNETGSDSSQINGETENQPKEKSMPLPEKLLLVISNLYLNAADRLKLDFPPRCAEDLEFCHQHHYRAPIPEAPNHTQATNLRLALQQQRYVSFVNWSFDMCHRGEFPGEGIFTKIIELLLSFNSKSYNNSSFGYFYYKFIELFSFIVRKFPPCWLTLRQFYINFFQTPLDASKISQKNPEPFKSDNILEILLDLLENTLEQCSTTDLKEDATDLNTPTPSAKDAAMAEAASKTMPNSDDTYAANSEYLNIWEWEKNENRLQTFEALQSSRVRLDRLFIALRMLLQILESDFVMWILHHHKKAKDWIFSEEHRPLIVLVFALTKYSRTTGTVKQLFKLFAVAVNKGVKRAHLVILERFISLLAEANNVADIEHSAIGVRYPHLGSETKIFLQEFFKIFKAQNISIVSSYLNTIDILRIPYVRCEFIDQFLQLFYFSHTESLSPKKIALDFSKRRWLKYKPNAELSENDEDLSREQYLQLLLTGLQTYAEWHGTKIFFQLLTKDKSVSCLRAVSDSVHRWPIKGSGVLMLPRMCKDIKDLEKQLRIAVRMSKPKVDLPLVDICIDTDLVLLYRTDLKFLMILNEMVTKQCVAAPDIDFTGWKTFLGDYVGN